MNESEFGPGIFTMKTPDQLLAKIRRECAKLQDTPWCTDLWFNFTVSVAQFPEWVYPVTDEDRANKKQTSTAAKQIQEGDSFPAIVWCYLLGTQAKHHEITNEKKLNLRAAKLSGTADISKPAFRSEVTTPAVRHAADSDVRPEFVLNVKGLGQIPCTQLATRALEECERALDESRRSSQPTHPGG